MSNEVCGDDRFELIAKAKKKLLDATNIDGSSDEIAVLDDILFRCWQMGWLDQLRDDDSRESYDAGFSNGVKACLQQLDGLIHEGADDCGHLRARESRRNRRRLRRAARMATR